MKVDVWSDFACPFCYIGKRRFEQALKTFDHQDEVEVSFKSFQLDPYAKKESDQNIYSVLAKKQGVSIEQAKGFTEQISLQAKELGLDYRFDTMILTNTFAAHRLSHYADKQGKMYEMIERILHAYFTESAKISDYEVLADLAAEVGLDRNKSMKVLEDGTFSEDVQNDQQLASQMGVQGVPFFVFNQKYAVSGAQPSEVFTEVLNKVYEEEKQASPVQIIQPNQSGTSNGGMCDDGSCSI
ncbi:DsbA family protein [Bacillus sp. 1P06AnD]|uniref:DsbA family oxidoreductase n=1 Tax=Bacillus sp. 1P06AnD TaxID=3132208 RepID=UPI0039A0BC8C